MAYESVWRVRGGDVGGRGSKKKVGRLDRSYVRGFFVSCVHRNLVPRTTHPPLCVCQLNVQRVSLCNELADSTALTGQRLHLLYHSVLYFLHPELKCSIVRGAREAVDV